MVEKLKAYWMLVTVVALLLAAGAGGAVAWLRYEPARPIEISFPGSQEWRGNVYIGGAVANPGLYPSGGKDTIDWLLQAAGGVTGSANLSALELKVPTTTENVPQKVNINRAEAWLLEALPGVGEALAARVVEYRQKNGPFRNTDDLLKVSGFGTGVYDRIKGLITVVDD